MAAYEELHLESGEKYQLSVMVFEAKQARAAVQIIHGMEERKERYIPLAQFLRENGYHVVVADLRGHGKDAPVLSHIADRCGEDLLLEDQRKITAFIRKRFQGLPVYLFGFSMGSMIARVLLQTDSAQYEKIVLVGYVCPNPLSRIAVALGHFLRAVKKPTARSALLTGLAFGSYGRTVKNQKTEMDWLSYNEENVREYIADPLCGVEFTTGSYCALFHLLDRMNETRRVSGVKENLPILLLSGRDDPCAGGDKGREASRKLLSMQGFEKISVITYDRMRHEILHEKESDRVFRDILSFYDGKEN